MTTKIFAAFVAAMMTITMSANNNVKNNNASAPDNTLPNVTVIATAQQKTMEVKAGNRHMKYEYNLDDMGRVSTKVTYVKNIKNSWTPISAYSVFYGSEETVLTFAEYDMITNAYTANAKQVRYNAAEYPEIIPVPMK